MVNIDPGKAKDLTIAMNGQTVKTVKGRILRTEKLQDYNSFNKPDRIKPVAFNAAKIEGKSLKLTLPPFSVVVLELR
jgi:alpha-N-arabinofuranosidase